MEIIIRYLSILIIILFAGCGSSGENSAEGNAPRQPCGLAGTINLCVIEHNGISRSYLIYVPENYSGQEPVPLLFNFHGWGSNATDQHFYANFRNLADGNDQFVLVVPEGTLLDGKTHWAVGSWTIDSTADDIGFVKTLIDVVSSDYLIDATRVYATGMSNGGYMSYHLACNLSHRIAAIASVTGSMSFETFDGCQPAQPTSVLQIHGTADSVVPINGDTWTKPIDDVIDYWVTYNGCDIEPVITAVPDINEDGVISEQLSYNNCIGGTEIHYYRMNDMGHVWPEEYRGDDLRGSLVIWEFLSQYSTQGRIN
jgi:polyhydroxybutyrate depolymerase